MIFDFTDAWLLQSAYRSQNESGSLSIAGIIGFCDYTNHAIITYQEFTASVQKFISIGMIIKTDSGLSTTKILNTWWDMNIKGKRKISLDKELVLIQEKLNKTFEDFEIIKHGTVINEDAYRIAVKHYTSGS